MMLGSTSQRMPVGYGARLRVLVALRRDRHGRAPRRQRGKQLRAARRHAAARARARARAKHRAAKPGRGRRMR